MRSPRTYARLAGAVGPIVLTAMSTMAGCSVRVGSGSPPEDTSEDQLPSACARLGNETKIPFTIGAEAFAFAWDTDHYVLVYANPSTGDGDIYVGRLAADGSPMGAPLAVDSTPGKSDLPSLLRTQTGYAVVWQEGTAGQAVIAHALNADATPIGTSVAIASTQSNQSRPVLSHAPDGMVAVTWMDAIQGKGGVQIALIDPTLTKTVGPQRVAPTDIDGWPWVAGDDNTLAMAWSDKLVGPYDVHFALIDPANLTMSTPTSIRGVARRDALLPRMIRTSFGYLAAWEDQRGTEGQIYMALVDPAGNRIGGGLVEESNSGDANWPNIAWTGKAAGIVYYQWRSSRPQIFMSFVDATGARVGGLHDLQVSRGTAGWSKYPDVVFTGKEFGVMYVDDRDGAPAIWLQRVSCAG
jgi:hypothetical protein